MLITNLTDNDYWFGPMYLPAGSGQQITLDDTTDTSLYLLNDEVADAVNTLVLASNIAVSSAATPFPRATGTPSLLHGDGSPEGLVYAPQGSLYLRRDTVAASTSLYSKQTGVTQNTGWASVIAPAPGDLVASAATSRIGCLLCDGTSYAETTLAGTVCGDRHSLRVGRRRLFQRPGSAWPSPARRGHRDGSGCDRLVARPAARRRGRRWRRADPHPGDRGDAFPPARMGLRHHLGRQ